MLWALDTDHSVDAVGAVCGSTALGVDSKVFVGGVWTTQLAASVLSGPTLSVAAEEADEFVVTPADVDDDRADSEVLRFCVTSEAVVLAVVCVGVDAVSALASDDA